MPRAIDFHVHSSTAEWLEGSLGPMAEATARYFRTEVRVRTPEEMAAEFEAWDLIGVLLAWDAETATGLPRSPTTAWPRSAPPSRDVSSALRRSTRTSPMPSTSSSVR